MPSSVVCLVCVDLSRGAIFVILAIVVAASKKIGHDFDALIAGVVQARQTETSLQRLEQREVRIALRTLHAMDAIIGIHNQHDLIHIGHKAVVVFIPENNDRVAAISPGRRRMNRLDQVAQREVTHVNQRWVQSGLAAVVVRIKIAGGAGIATSMLVIALIGSDKRELGRATGVEVLKQTMRPFEANDMLQADRGLLAFLHTAEVDERIVFGCVELDETLRFAGGHRIDVRVIGEKAITETDRIGSGGRQAFLIALPVAPLGSQLVCDSLADQLAAEGRNWKSYQESL